MRRFAIALVLMLCLTGTALGETFSFTGVVQASETCPVYAPIGGTVESVPVTVGQKVGAETVLAVLKTTKVYAPEDGTVTAVYGVPGDTAESVAAEYGAVMYLEGKTLFTVSCSTARAFSAKENFIVHSGETVYLVSRNHTADKGTGIITAVADSSFTVQVTEGDFYAGDSIEVYREADLANASRIGRGSVARVSPAAVTGEGSIVSYAVKAGETVSRGQLLFETLDGTFDGLVSTGTEITAGVAGTLSALNVEPGTAVSKGASVAVIYPENKVWVAAEVPEADLKELFVGQKVEVELDWNQDRGIVYEGEIALISGLGTVGEESTTYTVYVSFQPDEYTRYSMTAVVTTLEELEEPEEDAGEPAETDETVSE